jgi:hypothetical protein
VFLLAPLVLLGLGLEGQAQSKRSSLPVPHVTVGHRTVGHVPDRPTPAYLGGMACGTFGDPLCHVGRMTLLRIYVIPTFGYLPPAGPVPTGSGYPVLAGSPSGSLAPGSQYSWSASQSEGAAAATSRPSQAPPAYRPPARPTSRDFEFHVDSSVFVRAMFRTPSGLSADHSSLELLQAGQNVTVRLKTNDEVSGTLQSVTQSGSSYRLVLRVQGSGEIPDLPATEVVTLFIRTPISKSDAVALK